MSVCSEDIAVLAAQFRPLVEIALEENWSFDEFRVAVVRWIDPDGTFTKADLPPWPGGRHPDFHMDANVRELLTILHRIVSLDEAVARCRILFGKELTPSRSALNRFWMHLDKEKRRG